MFLSTQTYFDHIEKPGRNLDFNKHWQFSLNNGAFSDVELPHDWSIHFDFNHKSPAQNEAALLDGGLGRYRKIFTINPRLEKHKILLYFSAVYMDSKVFVNGHYLGWCPNGYMPFYFYIEEYLYFDRPNRIEVIVNHQQPSSRWYSGSGIYRDVSLHVLDDCHFLPHRTHLSYDWERKEILVDTQLSQTADQIKIKIFDQAQELKSWSLLVKNTENQASFFFPHLQAWDLSHPKLYDIHLELIKNNQVLDQIEIRTGFKDMHWDPDTGFYLNGKSVLLKGVCMHHDQGSLGACAYEGAMLRQLSLLKNIGVNAIRTAHTPFDKKFLSLCDSMGFLVIEEAFDTWYEAKKEFDYARFFEEKAETTFSTNDTWAKWDLQEMVRKSFNHPSVIMWSIGNEIAESNSGSEKALTTVKNLVKWVKEIDKTRYVTMGQDVYRWAAEGEHEKISQELDVVGLNYSEDNFEQIRIKHPDWKIYGAETSSATRSRGVFALPDSNVKHDNRDERNFQQSDYGNDCVTWGKTAFESLSFDHAHPDYAGQFVWTGFDYLGEPTPWHNQNDTPANSSYFGLIDSAGFLKSDAYFYQSQWSDKKVLHVIPHWTWDIHKIQKILQTADGRIPVRAYTNCENAELFINGKSLGKQSYSQNNELYFQWRVDYEPGVLEVYAWDHKDEKLCHKIETADKERKFELNVKKFKNLHYVEISATDHKNCFQAWAENDLFFHLEGDAEIVGVDNGNPASLERYQKDHDGQWKRKLFSGKALVILKEDEHCEFFKLSINSKDLETCFYQYNQEETVQSLKIEVEHQELKIYEYLKPQLFKNGIRINPDKAEWYASIEGLKVQNGKLYFEKAGTYTIQAKYKNHESNPIVITVEHREVETTSEKYQVQSLNGVCLQEAHEIYAMVPKGPIHSKINTPEKHCIYEKRSIKELEKIDLLCNLNQTPILPNKINITLDNGERLIEDVLWQKLEPRSFSKLGEYPVNGLVSHFNIPVSAMVKVTDNYSLGQNIAQVWTGSLLPMAFATHSDQGDVLALNDVSTTSYWQSKQGCAGILFGEKGDLRKQYVNNIRIYGKNLDKHLEVFCYQGSKPPMIQNPNAIAQEPHPFNNLENWKKMEILKKHGDHKIMTFTLKGEETFAIMISSKQSLDLSEIEIYEAIPK